MARRLYLGRLPPETRPDDVNKFFEGFGRIVDCRVMTGFGFVEFENPKDAEDAVHQFNGKPFMGANILVEFAKESRPRREHYDSDRGGFGGGGGGGGGARARRPPGIRLLVQGVSRDTSWQDLKDFGRECGNVTFADIDRDIPGQGILEYAQREDADRAIRELDGRDLRGKVVRVTIDETRGPDNYRRDDRPPREDRYRDDRYRDDRYNREDRAPYRRERSRSPGRRGGEYDRRPRSPPRKEPAVYDEYRRGYDERRPPTETHERRREEDRYDGRRREEREFEERAPRHANGDGSWVAR